MFFSQTEGGTLKSSKDMKISEKKKVVFVVRPVVATLGGMFSVLTLLKCGVVLSFCRIALG